MLRDLPSQGGVITLSNPRGLFALSSGSLPYDIRPPTIFGVRFEAAEAY